MKRSDAWAQAWCLDNANEELYQLLKSKQKIIRIPQKITELWNKTRKKQFAVSGEDTKEIKIN